MVSRQHLEHSVIGLALLMPLTGPARADMTLVRRAVYDNPRSKALGLPSVLENKILISGGKTRVEEPPLYFIEDTENGRSLLLDSARRIALVTRYTAPQPRAGAEKTICEATSEVKTFLGHRCRRYRLSQTSKSPQIGDIVADVYVAQDLPVVDVFSASRGPAWMLHEGFQGLPGMPLQMTMTQTRLGAGKVVTGVMIVSLSVSAVPASAFAAPNGYQIVAPPPPPKPPRTGGSAP